MKKVTKKSKVHPQVFKTGNKGGEGGGKGMVEKKGLGSLSHSGEHPVVPGNGQVNKT